MKKENAGHSKRRLLSSRRYCVHQEESFLVQTSIYKYTLHLSILF